MVNLERTRRPAVGPLCGFDMQQYSFSLISIHIHTHMGKYDKQIHLKNRPEQTQVLVVLSC